MEYFCHCEFSHFIFALTMDNNWLHCHSNNVNSAYFLCGVLFFLFQMGGLNYMVFFLWKFAVIRFSANSEYRISTDDYGVKMIATTKTTATMTTTTTTTTATNTTPTNTMKSKEFSVNHERKKITNSTNEENDKKVELSFDCVHFARILTFAPKIWESSLNQP